MKASEAPEKIYIALDEIDDLALDHRFDYPICTEYTRTDVFIEKAEGWLREVQKGFILTDKDITDFVNYMKG